MWGAQFESFEQNYVLHFTITLYEKDDVAEILMFFTKDWTLKCTIVNLSKQNVY